MVAGYTGTQQRATYTCVGNTVNLAARLKTHTKAAQRTILIDPQTRDVLPDDVRTEALGPVEFKGMSVAIDVYSVDCGQQR